MGLHVRSLKIAALVAASISLSSCSLIMYDPCPVEETFFPGDEGIEDVGQMDFVWTLRAGGGVFLPFPNPQDPTDAAESVKLYFETTDAEEGSGGCDDVRKTKGTVTAVMATKDLFSPRRDTVRFAGSFERDHKSNTTTIKYGKYAVPLVRTGTTFTLATAALAGLSDKEKKNLAWLFALNLTLHFQRTSGPGPIFNRIPAAPTLEARP